MKLTFTEICGICIIIFMFIGLIVYQQNNGAFDNSILADRPAEELIMQDYVEPETVQEKQISVKNIKKSSPKALIDGKMVSVKIVLSKLEKFESTMIYISRKHLDEQIGIASYSTNRNHGFVTITPENDFVYISGIPTNVVKNSKTIVITLSSNKIITITK